MPIHINRHRLRKQERIAREWPDVDDQVFQDLELSRETLAKLEIQLVGKIVLPGMADYDRDRQEAILTPYSSAYPRIIVYCETDSDVRLCLEWAHQYHWWVTCRSGGHSFAGFSVNNGMIIDLSGINHVIVENKNKLVRVGAGTQFTKMEAELNSYNLHVPTGTCPDVAVAGFMQGGGYGLLSREYGIQCDLVAEVKVMLANGRIVVANTEQNQDLFWAVRGGTGGNFGVLLEVIYRLFELEKLWGYVYQWSIEDSPRVLATLQEQHMKTGRSDQLGYMAVLAVKEGAPVLLMMGMYNGPKAEGEKVLSSVLNIGSPQNVVDKVDTYANLVDPIFETLPGIPPGQPMLSRSGYVGSPISFPDWEKITAFFSQTPNPYNIMGIEPYGGAIRRGPSSPNAFIHRDVYMNLFLFGFIGKDPESESGKCDKKWIDDFYDMMRPHYNGHMYQNYPDPDFPDYRWAYWGNDFNSLLFVKQKYDPENFFHYAQSISPYPTAEQGITRSDAPSRFSDMTIVY